MSRRSLARATRKIETIEGHDVAVYTPVRKAPKKRPHITLTLIDGSTHPLVFSRRRRQYERQMAVVKHFPGLDSLTISWK